MEDITILIPSWNRRKFLPLVIRNLETQDYPHEHIQVIIDDDGSDKLIQSQEELEVIQKHLHPIKVKYINNKPKRTIGAKRNDLVKSATTKIVCYMDDDDVYMPTYLSYTYSMLKKHKVGCVGSNKMIFTMSSKNFDIHAIDCGDNKSLIHEATMMFSKKWFSASQKFANSSQGEGACIFQGHHKTVAITDVVQQMICLEHDSNTVNKLQFATEQTKIDISLDDKLINIIKNILENKMLS